MVFFSCKGKQCRILVRKNCSKFGLSGQDQDSCPHCRQFCQILQFTTIERRKSLRERFPQASCSLLLTLRTDCSRFTSKPAICQPIYQLQPDTPSVRRLHLLPRTSLLLRAASPVCFVWPFFISLLLFLVFPFIPPFLLALTRSFSLLGERRLMKAGRNSSANSLRMSWASGRDFIPLTNRTILCYLLITRVIYE